MLSKIEISNFKAIQDELNSDGTLKEAKPLILDNLAPINYLVGPNGCGKSSVLECLFIDGFGYNKKLDDFTFKINKNTINEQCLINNIVYLGPKKIENIEEYLKKFLRIWI